MSYRSLPMETYTTSAPSSDPRMLDRAEVEQIVSKLRSFVKTGEISIGVQSWWNGELRWARNRVSLASDRRSITVSIGRGIGRGLSYSSTNQLDDVSLEAAVRAAERTASLRGTTVREPKPLDAGVPVLEAPAVKIWSDTTYNVTAEQRGELARTLSEDAEAKGMFAAGYLEMRAGESASFFSKNMFGNPGWEPETVQYQQYTQAQCSMTVRHPKGLGSGWAGLSSFDWSAIDGRGLSKRALDKCLASLNSVAIEPGRYTTILEPQAVADLINLLFFGQYMNRSNAEQGVGPFVLGYDSGIKLWRTKLGLKVADPRVTISHDPTNPLLGDLPRPGYRPLTYIERGILKELAYIRREALTGLREHWPASPRLTWQMTGGDTSMDEMIATTKRGLLVTRFSSMAVLDSNSVLSTGITRDGLWLVENGKISKPVKNMRFTESPIFMLNQIDQLGPSVPVFYPVRDPSEALLTPVIAPSLKVNDFSFTSMVDAV